VVILGGGVAGVEAMLALRDLAGDRVELEMHAPQSDFVYRPLAITEPFDHAEALRFDLRQMTERCGARLWLDSVASVNTQRRRIITHDRDELAYDYLVVACGTRSTQSVPGVTTFWGVSDEAAATQTIRELEAGVLERVVFTMPGGAGWPLPVYELALLAASQLAELEGRDAQLTIATPEDGPLRVFGRRASEQMSEFLARREIEVISGVHPVRFDRGMLFLAPGDPIAADAVLSLPRLEGRRIDGLPHDAGGFIEVDDRGRVRGLEGVFAAGDVTSFPVKQGGIASQQADAIAEEIAHRLGLGAEPRPFDPVLRATLLTGDQPHFLYGKLTGGHGETSIFSTQPPWSQEGKIAARYLGPFLESIAPGEDRAALLGG
jgi:sulfide:quinone oxidoreductase